MIGVSARVIVVQTAVITFWFDLSDEIPIHITIMRVVRIMRPSGSVRPHVNFSPAWIGVEILVRRIVRGMPVHGACGHGVAVRVHLTENWGAESFVVAGAKFCCGVSRKSHVHIETIGPKGVSGYRGGLFQCRFHHRAMHFIQRTSQVHFCIQSAF